MNALILSATASAINYLRALRGRPDLQLFVTDASPFASGLYAENVTPLLVPRARSLASYRAALDQLIREHAIDILVPTSDHDMEGVMELLRDGWVPPVAMFRPRYDIYRTLTHKARLLEAVQAAGLPVPRVYHQVQEVEYPAVVKPAREGGSKGVWIVRDRLELEERLEAHRRHFLGDVVMQEYIPGETGSIFVALLLYGSDGRLHGEVASHSHLTFMTWGGGGNAGAIVDEPLLLTQAKQIVASLGGWAGPVNLEFKRHAVTGQFYLLEVNCRLNGYSYLYTMNGLNFPAAIMDLLTTGHTHFLSLPANQHQRNFVIGFREQTVEDWIRAAS